MSKKHVGLAVVCAAAVFCATNLFALTPQTVWTRTYGDTLSEIGESVQQTSDGGYIIAGETNSLGAGDYDVYLIKTDASGDTVWTRTYGDTLEDYGHSVQQTSDGGYIIGGTTSSFGAGGRDVYLIKTDASGDTAWTRTYGGTGGDEGRSVQQTADDGYIIAGATTSFGAGSYDVYLIKTDELGHPLWARTYGDTGWDVGSSVEQTGDGGYIVGGWTDSFGAGDNDAYLIKTDASGDTLWTRTYGGADDDGVGSIEQTTDGGYIGVGAIRLFGTSNVDVYLLKTDASGDTLWTRTYGGAGTDYGTSVEQTTDGGYIVTGYTTSFGAGSHDVYLVRADSSGAVAWTRTYGGSGSDIGNSVQETSDGKYIIAGQTSSFGPGNLDVYLIRVREHNLKAKEVNLPMPPTPGRVTGDPVVAFSNEVSTRLILHSCTPSPFSERTVIRFDLVEQGEVKLSIHDVRGRLVRELARELRPQGYHSVPWDGRDLSGAEVSAGIYFVRVESEGTVATGKVVVAH